MYCGNCGTQNENVEFCSNCGKPTKSISKIDQKPIEGYPLSNDNQQPADDYPLSYLTAKLFRVLFEIALWFILFGGFIFRGVVGYNNTTQGHDPSGQVFIGIILGGFIAFVIIILIGGLVSLFIKLVNDTEEIKRKIK